MLTPQPTDATIPAMRDTIEPLDDDLIDHRRQAMVLAACQPPPNDGRTWPYDARLAAQIAERVAEGVSIHQQRADDPLTVPPASVVLAWRKQHPAFGLAMKHADLVRADLLREQALAIVDGFKGPPARLALMAGQRMKMADYLDPPSLGPAGQAPGTDPQPVSELSDETLARLAAAGLGAGEADAVGVASGAARGGG